MGLLNKTLENIQNELHPEVKEGKFMFKNLGSIIKSAREEQQISAKSLAKRIGCSETSITDYENGIRGQNILLMYSKMLNALGIQIYARKAILEPSGYKTGEGRKELQNKRRFKTHGSN